VEEYEDVQGQQTDPRNTDAPPSPPERERNFDQSNSKRNIDEVIIDEFINYGRSTLSTMMTCKRCSLVLERLLRKRRSERARKKMMYPQSFKVL
jgi:hypothetical protein